MTDLRVDPAPLPVAVALPALRAALAGGRAAVLEAPPGAGKSTVVPLALLDEPWLAGKRMLVLQPRRIAARAVAARLAELLGQSPGGTVGYRMRLDTCVGPSTRIEVVTEGILTRMLQRDPALEGVGLVIFDEFHERSLQADVGLAFALDAQRHLHPELRLLVMSATLDGVATARLLGDAPVVTAAGRSYPVETRYVGAVGPGSTGPRSTGARSTAPEGQTAAALAGNVTRAVVGAVREHEGDVLVFLPGAGEIRRVERLLGEAGARGDLPAACVIAPLYGDLSRAQQDAALKPAAPGMRRFVLATNIAETSLTIEGIRIVVDSGLERRNEFDPRSGMNRLVTRGIARASADQRRGRAGRLAPGVCYRLWTEAAQRARPAHAPPEIATADLAPLALELACWGTRDAAELRWLDPPQPGPLAAARALLELLGALDAEGRVTAHGREMEALGMHPRLAHLLLCARASGAAATGCALAALLGERDVLRTGGSVGGSSGGGAGGTYSRGSRDVDIRTRLELLARDGTRAGDDVRPDNMVPGKAGRDNVAPDNLVPDNVDRARLRLVRRSAENAARLLGAGKGGSFDPSDAGWLLAKAYPDRIARSRAPGGGRYQLSSGRGACFGEPQPLASSEFLVVPELDAGDTEARIFLAVPVALSELEAHFADDIVDVNEVSWDPRAEAVLARRQRRLGALVLHEAATTRPDPPALQAALFQGIRTLGISALPWTPALRQWQARVQRARALDPDADPPWPDVSDEALTGTLDEWLAGWVDGVSRREHFARIDLGAALQSMLSWPQREALEAALPSSLIVPSGSRIAIDYCDGPLPTLSVRLQEVFGLTETPRLAGGRVPVLMKLLSPARRPVQVTQDLASFWKSTYAEVRRELKGRYPKHYWPDDPHVAEPTRRTRPRAP